MAGFFGKDKSINRVLMIRVEAIRPNPAQPRRHFDEEELLALSRSIQKNGLLQPLTVRKLGEDRYELIAGERRLRAAKLAHCRAVPCLVVSVSEQQSAVFALLENIQRQDLSFFEQARGILTLMETWGISQEEAAGRLGMAQSTLANKLRLLRLSEPIQQLIAKLGLTERHARALLRLTKEEDQRQVLEEIGRQDLNVAQTEQLIGKLLQESGKPKAQKPKPVRIVKDVRIFYNTITNAVNLMRQSGIDAVAQRRESEEYIEFLLQIPKSQAQAGFSQQAGHSPNGETNTVSQPETA